MSYCEFTKNRITALRMQKGVSEYQMSYDLGRSKSYINNISSGKALPSLNELFTICEYFRLTPSEFFNTDTPSPTLLNELREQLNDLSEGDLCLLLSLIQRLKKNKV